MYKDSIILIYCPPPWHDFNGIDGFASDTQSNLYRALFATASYALRVPRAGDLRSASFRRRLAAEALAVQLTVPVISFRRRLTPPS